jgi:hypothetical protein
VPASSGGGIETLGAAALAVVAVLGGVAGGVRNGPERRASDSRTVRVAHPTALVPAGRMYSSQMLRRAEWPRPRRHSTGNGGAGVAPAAADLALAQTTAEAVPAFAALPPAPAVVTVEPAGAGAEAVVPAPPAEPAGDGAATVDQQNLAPSEGTLGGQPSGVAPAQTPAPPAVSTTGPAGPQSRLPVSRPPAKPRPVKPRPPAAVAPAPAPKPVRPAPATDPGRAQKPLAPPVRPKKRGPAPAER